MDHDKSSDKSGAAFFSCVQNQIRVQSRSLFTTILLTTLKRPSMEKIRISILREKERE